MNKKPIKRNENILKLSKEHHFSLLFCWKIRQGLKAGADSSRIIKYVQYFKTHFLLPHFSEEEIFLRTKIRVNAGASVQRWFCSEGYLVPCN